MQLSQALAGVIAEHGVDLEGVEISAAGNRSRITVIVGSDSGIDLDAIASISQSVSQVLDAPDGPALEVVGTGSYTLEVTSPGVDRPLTLPRHWRRNRGRLVEVTLTPEAAVSPDEADAAAQPKATAKKSAAKAKGRSISGRITQSTDTDVTISVDGAERTIPLSDIEHAVIRIEFNRPDEGR